MRTSLDQLTLDAVRAQLAKPKAQRAAVQMIICP
jgi:hypothetical protein